MRDIYALSAVGWPIDPPTSLNHNHYCLIFLYLNSAKNAMKIIGTKLDQLNHFGNGKENKKIQQYHKNGPFEFVN